MESQILSVLLEGDLSVEGGGGDRAGSQQPPGVMLHLMEGRTKFCSVRLSSLKVFTVTACPIWVDVVCGQCSLGEILLWRAEEGIPYPQHFLRTPFYYDG